MSRQIEFCMNSASTAEIAEHLLQCDADFVPPLTGRIELGSYAQKIAAKATLFEARADRALVGLVAAYCNDSDRRIAYVTSVSVLQEWRGRGIALRLLEQCIGHAAEQGFERIELEVDSENVGAIQLYGKKDFMISRVNGRSAIMCLDIRKEA